MRVGRHEITEGQVEKALDTLKAGEAPFVLADARQALMEAGVHPFAADAAATRMLQRLRKDETLQFEDGRWRFAETRTPSP